jgi:hypothetical protein
MKFRSLYQVANLSHEFMRKLGVFLEVARLAKQLQVTLVIASTLNQWVNVVYVVFRPKQYMATRTFPALQVE